MMANHLLSSCPSCQEPLTVTEVTCPACELRLQGQFQRGCRFCALDPEQTGLLDVFLRCRGVIKDMEAALGLSYPTVRSRLDGLLATLGYAPVKAEAEDEGEDERAGRRQQILDRLQAGEIEAEEATKLLRELAK
jgi:hypothetical protein